MRLSDTMKRNRYFSNRTYIILLHPHNRYFTNDISNGSCAALIQ